MGNALTATRKAIIAGVAGLAIVLSGCVLSVDPVISETAATFDARLLGTWEEADGSDRATVSRGKQSTYTIEYTSDGKVGTFEARLGRLGERLVLDVWPAPAEKDMPGLYAALMLGTHVLFSLDIGATELRMAMIEPDALIAALRGGQLRLPYTRSDDQLVLRGSPEEMRTALGAYLRTGGKLAEAVVWRRAREGVAPPAGPVEPPCFEASTWREADQLFHRDPHWLGADVASSVDLGGGRVLWLFGDTWIDPSGKGSRQNVTMVSNSLAIQTGTNPTTAAISFYWGHAADGKPAPFFADRGAEALWLGNGVRVRDRLVVFFARTLRGGPGLGFHQVGWTAVMVENPDSEPSAWRVRPLETPENPMGVLVGFATVLQLGDYVYALGSLDPVKSHPIYAARWPAEMVHRGDLLQPEWWAGERFGWVPDSSSRPRWPLFENAQSELTVHVDRSTQRFLAVHTQGFGPADLMMRAAPALTGRWSAPRMLYRPAEYYRPNVMIYAGKAHPELTGADLVLTYATNSFQFAELLADSMIYYPRFVRLSHCRAPSAAHAGPPAADQ